MFYCNYPISFVTSFFKFQHSPTLVTSFLSFQLLPSVCCQVVHFVTSVLTFHLVYKPPSFHLLRLLQSVRYFNSFVDSLQLFPFIHFLPFVSTLPFRSDVPVVSTLSFHSLLSSFRFNSLLSFVTSFLSFQLWHPVPYCFPSFQVVHCWPWSKRFPTWVIITKAFNLTMIKFISPLRLKNMIRIEPKVLEIWWSSAKGLLYTGGKQW